MSTTAWIVIGATVYLGIVVFTLAILRAASHADDQRTLVTPTVSWRVVAADEASGRLAADVHAVLHVEHVAVVLREREDPALGTVTACSRGLRLCGDHVPADACPIAAARSLDVSPFAGQGVAAVVASTPIGTEEPPIGTIWMASGTRPEGFSARDLDFLERLGKRAARLGERTFGAAPATPAR